MDQWSAAEFDAITHDLTAQLLMATERGWQREKPEHYRAAVAAIESVLAERRAMVERPVGAEARREQVAASATRATGLRQRALRWAMRLRFALGTASRDRAFRPVEMM